MKKKYSLFFLLLLALVFFAGCRNNAVEENVASETDLTKYQSEILTNELGVPVEMDENGNTFSYDTKRSLVQTDVQGQTITEPPHILSHSAAFTTTAQGTVVSTVPVSNNCTISISVSSIRNNMHLLPANKHQLVPGSGMLLGKTTMAFSEGETAYDLLVKTTRQRGIHLDSTYTAMYGSAYIKGIGNLYEFDCGGNSGWLYSVNGSTPAYGCGKYKVKTGDNVQFFYKCG